MVRCADKATAVKVKSEAPPALIFLDGDGTEFMRVGGITPESIEGHMRSALEKYGSREIAWKESAAPGKPTARIFVDERKESQAFLEALTDRWLAKHHEKLAFVKTPYGKDDPACKELKITSAPALVLLDKDGKEVDRLVAKTQVTSIRAFLLKNFPKLGLK